MNQFEIVTYVSAGFTKALEFTLPSWIENARAAKIVVYTDRVKAEAAHAAGVEYRPFFDEPCDGLAMACERKIEVLRDAYRRLVGCGHFCWLDADVYCAAPFGEVFKRMGSAEVAAARMFNHTNRGHGDLNAGVLFFRCAPRLPWFFDDWTRLTEELRPKGNWYEQAAASQLIHEAFHGLRPYHSAPVSENLYNLEDDSSFGFLLRIKRFKPKLIHFKNGWWKDQGLVKRVLDLTGSSVDVAGALG